MIVPLPLNLTVIVQIQHGYYLNTQKMTGYGKGIIIGKGDPSRTMIPIHNANHHGEGKSSENHRFYGWNDRVSFVQKIEIPSVPNSITHDIDIYVERELILEKGSGDIIRILIHRI